MKILIIGSGGREHALAWKIARSPQVKQIYVAPGNGGTSWSAAESPNGRAPSENVDIPISDLFGLCRFALEHHVDLTIVGPEAPLADGIVDLFHKEGLRIFGPTAAAAQLEASKAFSKAFMAEVAIPTAAYRTFTDYHEAMAFLATDQPDGQVVIKADGLAAGKGVVVCSGLGQAQTAVKLMLQDHAFGEAGQEIIIEERMTGPELSILAFSDGRTVLPLPPARDHKQVNDGDRGPNTGGMGAFAPVPDVDASFVQEIVDTVLQPAVDGMAMRGHPYVGVLYAGLMLTPDGPRVLEFNCRFGDPETQAVLPLLQNDLLDVMMACLSGQLDQIELTIDPGACAAVVMAAPGYPGSYPHGLPIDGLDAAQALAGVQVFQAGTSWTDGQLVTNGGRVLAVSGFGENLGHALARAYAGVEALTFQGAHFRRDIGRTAPKKD